MTTQQKKINAAKMALKRIRPGMCVGLGTGSTTNEFINLLGQEKQLLKTLRYASSSIQTEMFAKKYSIICEDIESYVFLFKKYKMLYILKSSTSLSGGNLVEVERL